MTGKQEVSAHSIKRWTATSGQDCNALFTAVWQYMKSQDSALSAKTSDLHLRATIGRTYIAVSRTTATATRFFCLLVVDLALKRELTATSLHGMLEVFTENVVRLTSAQKQVLARIAERKDLATPLTEDALAVGLDPRSRASLTGLLSELRMAGVIVEHDGHLVVPF